MLAGEREKQMIEIKEKERERWSYFKYWELCSGIFDLPIWNKLMLVPECDKLVK